jgi:AcrR family transcriptional regulator
MPRGDATERAKERLIAATLRLLAKQSADAISVRDIARAARVNHGLVHRHFGSKQALIREAARRASRVVHECQRDHGLLAFTLDLLTERPELAAIVARCCLDGPRDLLREAAPPRERLELYVAAIRRGLAGLGLDGMVDPYLVNAAGAAAVLGWVVFRPLFERGYGLPAEVDREVEALARLIDSVFTPPSPAASASKPPGPGG